MPKVALAFFTVAPIYILIGMGLGMYMAISEDHVLAPAHAHLNLLGFAVMSVMGAFYGLAGDRAPAKLAWASFWILNASVVVMVPSLALMLKGHPEVNPLLGLSSIGAVAAVAVFFVAVLRVWRKQA